MNHCLLFSFFLVFSVGAEERAWPRVFNGRPAKVVPLDPEQPDNRSWQTASFRILSEEKVTGAALAKIANTIESVPQLLQSLPVDLWFPAKTEEKPAIILCKDQEAFLKAGGGEGAMGYYNGRRNEVLIRADVFLSPLQAQPSRLIPKPNEDLLVHELVHLGMQGFLARSSPWFYEGLAEYIASAHLSGGRYRFHQIEADIRDHIRNYLPPDENGVLYLPKPDSLIPMNSRKWRALLGEANGREVFRPYAASLLLIHYFLSTRERQAKLAAYLDDLRNHRDFRKPLPVLTIPNDEHIASRLQAFWKPRGLTLAFK